MRGPSPWRTIGALLLALLALVVAPAAAAAPSIRVDAVPLLGDQMPGHHGWFSVRVRLVNDSAAKIEGHLLLEAQHPYGSNPQKVVTRSPFALAPKATVVLQLPTHALESQIPSLALRVVPTRGKTITRAIPSPRQPEPTILDLAEPSRWRPALLGKSVAVGKSRLFSPNLRVAVAERDPASGEPRLPLRASSYGAVSVVHAPSSVLATLASTRRYALVDWVAAGGTLAVSVERPEDLRSGPLPVLVGGTITPTAAPDDWTRGRRFLTMARAMGSSSRGSVFAAPGEDLSLTGYAGGNLELTPFGSSASYGLGEVHLLPANGSLPRPPRDKWFQRTLVDLARHHVLRQDTIPLRLGTLPTNDYKTSELHRRLDPNEASRWAIAVATILLLAYAGLAGPLNFHLASRSGRPLRAYVVLPVVSLVTLLLIVGLGVVAKGTSGNVRRLSLLQLGAGSRHAAAVHFRGFYTPSTEALLIRAEARGNTLDVSSGGADVPREIVVDRDGARLSDFKTRPWRTVVVREDGVLDLPGPISMLGQGQDLLVTNRSGRRLLGVIVKAPGETAVFFESIDDGASRKVNDGTPLAVGLGSPRSAKYRHLGVGRHDVGDKLRRAARGLDEAWSALESYAKDEIDWWPPDAPVLIGQLQGGLGHEVDSGFSVSEDRVLVRVVGWGEGR